MTVTRFAPSPNGPLHLGHAYSAITAHDIARERGGTFLLRIEDIDGTRSQPELSDEFRSDLDWLGLQWNEVPPQSTRLASYATAGERLKALGLLYPCRCTRKEIATAATQAGPEGLLYPGTCRGEDVDPSGAVAWRLDLEKTLDRVGPLEWTDELAGPQRVDLLPFGDLVLLRKEAPASYHLAATLDDAADGVTLVTRGRDLFSASHVHRLLQALLGLPVPVWHHHPLLLDASGEKLAKRRNSGEAGFGIAERRRAGEDGRALAEALRKQRFAAGISLSE